jgi:hypothetical protein
MKGEPLIYQKYYRRIGSPSRGSSSDSGALGSALTFQADRKNRRTAGSQVELKGTLYHDRLLHRTFSVSNITARAWSTEAIRTAAMIFASLIPFLRSSRASQCRCRNR